MLHSFLDPFPFIHLQLFPDENYLLLRAKQTLLLPAAVLNGLADFFFTPLGPELQRRHGLGYGREREL